MKKGLLVSFLIIVTSCSFLKNRNSKGASYDKKFESYLIKNAIDTNFYLIPKVKIIDQKFNHLLDSVIRSTESCEYFDHRIPFHHAFYVKSIDENVFVINAHLSIKEASGVFINRSIYNLNKPMNRGLFYYKNYLFFVDLDEDFIDFNFLELTECSHKILAPDMYKSKSWSSSLEFFIRGDKLEIVNNNICGEEILIQSTE